MCLETTAGINWFTEVLASFCTIPGLGKILKNNVSVYLHVFGNNSRNKLAHRVDFANICIMNSGLGKILNK